ncbi:MAG TPA: uL15 family ribosomal protein [Candidatus Thermoplasmatota archaeon]|nr:uL15 family ribosomal protein [Candidatus Thermoplasmatota archaeon]
MAKKTNKTHKNRGSREHGRGKKKGRGAGLRGGKGHAGSFGHRILHYRLYDPEHFDRKGFNRPQQVFEPQVAIDLRQLEERAERFLADGSVTREGDVYTVNLADVGYNKLLSTGTPRRKWRITVERASGNAVTRVKESGGEVTVTAVPKPPKAKAPPAPAGGPGKGAAKPGASAGGKSEKADAGRGAGRK